MVVSCTGFTAADAEAPTGAAMDTAASIDFAGALGEIGYLACRTMPWLLYTYGVLSSVGAAASPRSSLPFHHHHSQSNPDLLASWSLRGPHESPGPFNRTTRRAIPLTRGWPRGLHANSADAPSLYRVNEASLSFLNNPLTAFSGSARASRPRLRSSECRISGSRSCQILLDSKTIKTIFQILPRLYIGDANMVLLLKFGRLLGSFCVTHQNLFFLAF